MNHKEKQRLFTQLDEARCLEREAQRWLSKQTSLYNQCAMIRYLISVQNCIEFRRNRWLNWSLSLLCLHSSCDESGGNGWLVISRCAVVSSTINFVWLFTFNKWFNFACNFTFQYHNQTNLKQKAAISI